MLVCDCTDVEVDADQVEEARSDAVVAFCVMSGNEEHCAMSLKSLANGSLRPASAAEVWVNYRSLASVEQRVLALNHDVHPKVHRARACVRTPSDPLTDLYIAGTSRM